MTTSTGESLTKKPKTMSSSTDDDDDTFVSAISQKTAEEVEDEALTRNISEDLNGLIRLLHGVDAEMLHHSRIPEDRKAWYEAWKYVSKNIYLLERRRQRAMMTNGSAANHRGAGITVGSVNETIPAHQEVPRMQPAAAAGGFVQYNFEARVVQPLCIIPQTLREGDVVAIIRSEEATTFTIPLFIRQHLVDKLDEMKEKFEASTKLSRLYASGPPGCGKTCFYWMWALMKMQEGKRLLFIQYRAKPSIWIFEDKTLKRQVTSPPPNKYNLIHVVDQLLSNDEREFDYCVLDGVRMDVCENLVDMLRLATRTKKILKAIFVTSLQFKRRYLDEPQGIFFNKSFFMAFDSWNESDYDQAVGSGMLRDESTRNRLLHDWTFLTNSDAANNLIESDDDEKVKQAVKLKYFYAGGSARFMFDMDFLTLENDLDDLMEEIHRCDEWENFALNSLAGTGAQAVNSLMQRFTHKSITFFVPVSEFILRCAYPHCRGKLAASVEAAGDRTNNPTLLGWAFELAELNKIELALAQNKVAAGTTGGTQSGIQANIVASATGRNNELIFWPQFKAEYDGNEVYGDVKCGTVIWCDKWNQGCFDAAFYFECTLVTVQITKQQNQSLGLQFVRKLRESLLQKQVVIDRFVHLGVVQGDADRFRFAAAQGIERRHPPKIFDVTVVKSSELETISGTTSGSVASVCVVDDRQRTEQMFRID